MHSSRRVRDTLQLTAREAHYCQLRAAAMQVWLQVFAWSERGLRRKLAAREASISHCGSLRHAPMFCMERAIKLFHWSALVYKSDEQVGCPVDTIWPGTAPQVLLPDISVGAAACQVTASDAPTCVQTGEEVCRSLLVASSAGVC